MDNLITAAGIYKITNTITGNYYIGQSVNLKRRFHEHDLRLSKGIHFNAHLQNSWKKYGKDKFQYVVMLYCEREELDRYEQWFVDHLKPEYNILRECITSRKGLPGYWLGKKMTEEHRRKLSAGRIGVPLSEEHKKNISKGNKGIVFTEAHIQHLSMAHKGAVASDETRRKISIVHKGKPKSEENKRKVSEACKNYWKEHERVTQKGKPLSEEVRTKMSQSQMGHPGTMKGKHHSEATKIKIRAYRHTPEAIQKIIQAGTGRIFTKERKQNMSASQKRRRISELENKEKI